MDELMDEWLVDQTLQAWKKFDAWVKQQKKSKDKAFDEYMERRRQQSRP